MNRETREKISNIAYYLIIGLVSLLVSAFVPMIGTEIGLEWKLPNTTVGWVVFVISKLAIALVNMLIYHCFLQQAKLNVRNNEKYLKAKEILSQATIKKSVLPLSPGKWTARQYGGKGTSLFLGSVLSAVGFTQAVLTFDILVFMSLAFTLIMGIIFGYISMRKAEEYWTGEYYEYALMVEHDAKEAAKKEVCQDGVQERGDDIQESPRTSREE